MASMKPMKLAETSWMGGVLMSMVLVWVLFLLRW